VSSWMTYGPFSLADASAAELTCDIWLDVESEFDWFYVSVSVDEVSWFGWATTESTGGWLEATADLASIPDLGSALGEPEVWVSLGFESDGLDTLPEGAYVDNIVLRKCLAGGCTAAGHSPSADGGRPVELVPATMPDVHRVLLP